MFFTLLQFHTKNLLRIPFFLIQALMAPLSFYIVRYLGALHYGAVDLGQIWVISSLAGFWSCTICAVGLIGYQRSQGTLEYLGMSPISPNIVFGSLCASAAMLGLMGIPVSLVAQKILVGQVVVSWIDVCSLSLGLLACFTSSFILSALSIFSRSAIILERVLVMFVWFVCGIVIPVQYLPSFVQVFSLLHPFSGAVSLQHAAPAFLGDLHISSLCFWMIQSLLLSILFTVLAAFLARYTIRRARVNATLNLF